MAAIGECVAVSANDVDGLCELAKRKAVDLVVVGPEAPLVAGLADRLRGLEIPTFGPGAAGARLEGSKAFAKQFFARHGIPTADFGVAHSVAEADACITRLGGELVVKLDGLAAGKGVIVCSTDAEARAAARELLGAGQHATLVIERRIRGREISVLALTDGKRLVVLPEAEDHKTIFDGDRGPNTGGMGTVSPAWTSRALIDAVTARIFVPTLVGLAEEGIVYRGVLYAGVMVDAAGEPYALEYNCRFGDPETQPIMMRLRGDLGAVLAGAARGEMPMSMLSWDPRTAVCVVLAAAGYPSTPEAGAIIANVPAPTDECMVFHAGTVRQEDRLVVAGGRVLGVTALGATVEAARALAYQTVDAIDLPGKQVRRDIGLRGVSPRTPA